KARTCPRTPNHSKIIRHGYRAGLKRFTVCTNVGAATCSMNLFIRLTVAKIRRVKDFIPAWQAA
ncbi:MAG TPA: hypothetical protein VGO57_01935, partial [Verrucomicrobiae bacterium]